MNNKYEITDKDIESALLYLKHYDPDHATPDVAIAMLKDLRQGYHNIAHTDPARLLELKQEIDKNHEETAER